MEQITSHKLFRLGLLSCVLGLSFSLAFITFNGPPKVLVEGGEALTRQSEYSYLAAVRGSYSSRQPHSHSQYSLRSAQAVPVATATVAPVVVVPVTAPATLVATTTLVRAASSLVVQNTIVPASTQTSPAPAAISAAVASTSVIDPVPTPVPAVIPLGSKFGISVGATLSWLSDSALNAELDDMVSLGIGWVRYDFEWDQIQAGGSTSYNWTATDRVVKAINAHHLQLLPIIAYSPAWARPAGCSSYMCGPANPNDYATFAAAVVARYAPQGLHTWEIWNEPNIQQFWQPQPNPVAYAALLKAAYVAIKAKDPSATVVTAGLSPAPTAGTSISPLDFVTAMYQQGAKSYFDALGFHPYSYPALPSNTESWNAWAQMSTTANNLRSVMAANGDSNKKIWLTEFGSPTGGPGAGATVSNLNFPNSPDHVDEALQAKMMTEAISAWKGYSWAGPLFWYSYKDIGVAPTTNENFFGIIRFDGSLKPAYQTLKQLLGAQ